ncbi:MAG: DNA-dependent RNA polymerase auxiliary subunit epsilon family protein [Lactobacillales bacterium]|jgi:DNA-dependent RNA polymerase auxiliary subunit epsilon|nr:DNA-dependent RNA polymerase auxiliary subunit epsilon family protein [Lactobacillales bacterium]
MSIFKAFYQATKTNAPLRENTKSLYVEADDDIIAREYLETRSELFETIVALNDVEVAYEQANNPDFAVINTSGKDVKVKVTAKVPAAFAKESE